MPPIRKTTKSILLALYVVQVILTVPLAFDVGGNRCGLSYTCALCALYAALNLLRIVFARTTVLRALFYLQHLLIPSLLIYFLSSDRSFPGLALWNAALKKLTGLFVVAEGVCTLLLIQAIGKSFEWLVHKLGPPTRRDYRMLLSLVVLGLVLTLLFYFLHNVFTLPDVAIGLVSATLLGAVVTYCLGLALYGILLLNGLPIELALIFAYIVKCVYQTFPTLTNSTNRQINELIAQTTAGFRSELDRNVTSLTRLGWFQGYIASFPALPQVVVRSFVLLAFFMVDAAQCLTVLLVFSLAFRILVFYAATRIIPALQHVPAPPLMVVTEPEDDVEREYTDPEVALVLSEALSEQLRLRAEHLESVEQEKRTALHQRSVLSLESALESVLESALQSALQSRRTPLHRVTSPAPLHVLYLYAPCVIIAVYTNLMLLQRNEIDQDLVLWGWWMPRNEAVVVNQVQFWNWLNMVVLLGLYTLELLDA